MSVVLTLNVEAPDTLARQRVSLLRPIEQVRPAIVFLQEAKRIDADRLLGPRYGVFQLTDAGDARAGSAVIWDKTQCDQVGPPHLVIAADVPPGADLLDRFLACVPLRVQDALVVDACAGHRPPLRDHQYWDEFDTAVLRIANRFPRPFLGGIDANERGATSLRQHTGLAWRGVGIDGFLYDPRLTLGRARVLSDTPSDHRPVAANLRGVVL